MAQTVVMILTEFLLARIAEDEAEAWRWNADAGTGDWDSLESRVLAECEAKRRLVRAAESAPTSDGLRFAIATLAAVYADHPDYDEHWLD